MSLRDFSLDLETTRLSALERTIKPQHSLTDRCSLCLPLQQDLAMFLRRHKVESDEFWDSEDNQPAGTRNFSPYTISRLNSWIYLRIFLYIFSNVTFFFFGQNNRISAQNPLWGEKKGQKNPTTLTSV